MSAALFAHTGGEIEPGRIAFVRLTPSNGEFCLVNALGPRAAIWVQPVDRHAWGWKKQVRVTADQVDDVLIPQEVADMRAHDGLPPLPQGAVA